MFEEFREGNQPPGSKNLEFLKRCIRQMPKRKRIKYSRADEASYQADIINYCDRHDIEFAISGS
jgi:hypothetical protein